VHAPQPGGEEHLAQLRLQPHAGQILAQAGVDEDLAQRRGGHLNEQVLQDMPGQIVRRTGGFAHDPVHGQHGPLDVVPVLLVLVADRIALKDPPGSGKGGLKRHLRGHGQGLEIMKPITQQFQSVIRVVVAGKEDQGIGGMIVATMEVQEALEGQVWDVRRVTAGIQTVGDVRKQRLLGVFGQQAVRRGVGALHLVVDHPLDGQGAVRGDLIMPAFLAEDLRGQAGMKHGVQIHVDEIVEIREVLAGYGVAGLVRIGEGVQKGLQGALEQLHKGLLDRIFARSTEHGMLQDVGHARGVVRRGAEGDPENLVLVVVDQGQKPGPGGSVLEKTGRGTKFRDPGGLQRCKVMGHGGMSP